MARYVHPLFLVVLFALASVAQDSASSAYSALLERVKKADPKADFLKLRMAFTETAAYDPYDTDSTRDEMAEALEKQAYSRAAALAQKVLKKNFVDIMAHLVAHSAYARLKKDDQAKFHRTVYDGLIQSILKSGDGMSTSTAYVVISVDEEYAVLDFLRIDTTQQGLLLKDEQQFDQITGVDHKNQRNVTLYFNVTKPLSWAQDRSKKGK